MNTPFGPGARSRDKIERLRIDDVPVYQLPDSSTFFCEAGMNIDADGAPTAYHPPPHPELGLDALSNAGHPGSWWGVVTDTGTPSGTPIVQGPADPAPGFYVSTTSLQDSARPPNDPRRYVDATQIPYIVLPPPAQLQFGVDLGDFAVVIRRADGQRAGAIFADVGPADKIGEGSVALADALGIPSDPRVGGTNGGVIYVVFPGSGNGQPREPDTIQKESEALFESFGGMAQIEACFP